MKKNTGLVVALVIFIILTIASCGYIAYDKLLVKEEKVVEKKEEKEVQEEPKEEEKIYDVQIKTSEGFVYLDDNKLYKSENDEITEIADNVIDLYKKNDKIYAILEEEKDLTDDSINFLHQESLEYSNGSKRTIECSKLLSPEGFAGSSSHKIILIGDELYYSNTNEGVYNLRLVATGISDISKEGESVIASKTDAFEKHDDLTYIEYK